MPRDPAALRGGFRGRKLLILGSAACLWDDLEAIGDDDWAGDRMAVNLSAIFYDRHRLRHWATVHPDGYGFQCEVPWWRRRPDRQGKAFDLHGATFATKAREVSLASRNPKPDDIVEWPWPGRRRQGTSSLFAAHVAVQLGYDRIVLCGVPLDGSGYFFRKHRVADQESRTFARRHCHDMWREVAPEWGGKVTSMSGFTRELLGEPQHG